MLAILLFFNLQSVSTLATMIDMMMENSTTMDFLEAAGIRFSLVMIGVLSSLVVNLLFIPPKYETKMYHNCFNITSDIFKWIRLELNAVSEYQIVKKDIESLRTRVVTLDDDVSLVPGGEELDLFNKKMAYHEQIFMKITEKIP